LSLAYQYGNPNPPKVKEEYAKVKAEQALRAFKDLPLKKQEFQTLNRNMTAYMR
jgi:hypothetical protein